MKYENEGMDCKKLLLLFLGKFWIVIIAVAAGAVLGGGAYLFHHVVLNSHREYQAKSKLYLDFAPDESGEIYQEYNGYTWNDLMSTTLILDTTLSLLPDGYTKEEVVAATSAQILSDLRVLRITITTASPDKTAEILKATDLSLVEMGKREKEFIDIEIIEETEPEMVTVSPRLLQAVLLGFMIAFFLVLLAMALFYVLDNKVYVPGDFKVITDLPFIGFAFEKKDGGMSEKMSERERKLFGRLQEDLQKNQAYLKHTGQTFTIFEMEKSRPVTEEEYVKLREAGGVLLSVPYGKMDRSSCAYLMEQMEVQGCTLLGMIIRDADMRFIKWYYNHL